MINDRNTALRPLQHRQLWQLSFSKWKPTGLHQFPFYGKLLRSVPISLALLTPAKRLCFTRRLSVRLSVCLSAKNYWLDFHFKLISEMYLWTGKSHQIVEVIQIQSRCGVRIRLGEGLRSSSAHVINCSCNRIPLTNPLNSRIPTKAPE